MKKFEPDWTIPPGAHLEEWREENCMPLPMLQRKLNLRADQLNDILRGRVVLDEHMMLRLESITSIPAQFWRKAQATYIADLERGAKPSID